MGFKKKAEDDLNKQVTIKVLIAQTLDTLLVPLLMLMESWRLPLLLSIPHRALCFVFIFNSNRQSTFCSTYLAGLMTSTITLVTG